MKPRLIIFIKNPIKGKVKTRLATDIGYEKAHRIYLELMEKTRLACHNLPFDKVVYYSDAIEHTDIWDKEVFAKKRQKGQDLGEKMLNAFNDAFNDGYGNVCIIGSDCFEMSEDIIKSAFDKLNNNDVVIGPSADGGYYLLGMTKLFENIFEDKPWSKPTLLQVTTNELNNSGIKYSLLSELNDIDTIEDIVQDELLKILKAS